MAGKSSGNRVDGKKDLFPTFSQVISHFLDNVLSLGDGHSITRNDDHLFRIHQLVFDLIMGHRRNLPGFLRRSDHGSFGHTKPSGNHTDEGTVHTPAHDVAEDCTGTADQGAGDDEQVVGKHETCSRCGPA